MFSQLSNKDKESGDKDDSGLLREACLILPGRPEP